MLLIIFDKDGENAVGVGCEPIDLENGSSNELFNSSMFSLAGASLTAELTIWMSTRLAF